MAERKRKVTSVSLQISGSAGTIAVDAEGTEKVKDLKEKFALETQIHADTFALSFEDEELEDDTQVMYLPLEDMSELKVIPKVMDAFTQKLKRLEKELQSADTNYDLEQRLLETQFTTKQNIMKRTYKYKVAAVHLSIGDACIMEARDNKNMAHDETALQHLRMAMEVWGELSGTHEQLAFCLQGIGEVYVNRQNKDAAIEHFTTSTKMLKKCSSQHKLLPAWLQRLGDTHPPGADIARHHYQEAVDIAKRLNKPTAPHLCSLALWHEGKKEYPPAVEYLTEALMEHSERKNFEAMPSIFNKLGNCLCDMGSFLTAMEPFQKALLVERMLNPRDLPTCATYLYNLGWCSEQEGDLASAREYYEEALDVYRAQPTGDHYAEIADVLCNIGDCCECTDTSLGYYTKALEIERKSHPTGTGTKDTAGYLCRMGDRFTDSDNNDSALTCYQKALDTYEKHFPSDHLSIANIHHKIGLAHVGLSDCLEHQKKALGIVKRLYPEGGDDSVAEYLLAVGGVYENLGDSSAALSHFEEALEVSKRLKNTNLTAEITEAVMGVKGGGGGGGGGR